MTDYIEKRNNSPDGSLRRGIVLCVAELRRLYSYGDR
jgi:hypothetical protein